MLKFSIVVISLYLVVNLLIIRKYSTLLDACIDYGSKHMGFTSSRLPYFIVLMFGAVFLFGSILKEKSSNINDRENIERILDEINKH